MLSSPLARAMRLAVLFVSLAVLAPSSAFALSTFTQLAVHMRSGPGRQFAVVTVLAPQTAVRVSGCTSDWRWCDVSARRHRGWVDARYLSPPPRGRVRVVSGHSRR